MQAMRGQYSHRHRPGQNRRLVIRDLLGTGIDLIACKDFH